MSFFQIFDLSNTWGYRSELTIAAAQIKAAYFVYKLCFFPSNVAGCNLSGLSCGKELFKIVLVCPTLCNSDLTVNKTTTWYQPRVSHFRIFWCITKNKSKYYYLQLQGNTEIKPQLAPHFPIKHIFSQVTTINIYVLNPKSLI